LLIGAIALVSIVSTDRVWAQGVSVEEATTQQKWEAQQEYSKAKTARRARRYEQALAGFKKSYAIVASPNSHWQVVRTLILLERYVEAFEQAHAVAAEADAAAVRHAKYKKTAAAARAKANELKAKIGMITVQVVGLPPEEIKAAAEAPPDEDRLPKLTVGGQVIPVAKWGKPVPVPPGTSRVVLMSEMGTETGEVTVNAGEHMTLTIGPQLPPTTKPTEEPDDDKGDEKGIWGGDERLRIPSYVALGVGGAGMVMFAIFGALSSATFNDLEEQCPNAHCPAGLEDDANTARGQQVIANVSVAIGAVGITAGAALFVMGHFNVFGSDDDDQATKPEVAVGPGSIAIRGRF